MLQLEIRVLITFSIFVKMRIVERVTLDAEWVIILVDVQIAWSN